MKRVLLMVIPENMQLLHVVTASNGMWLPLTVQRKCQLKLELPMLAGETLSFYNDDKELQPQLQTLKLKADGKLQLTLQPQGGAVLVQDWKTNEKEMGLICLPISKTIHIVYISQSAMTDIHLRM